MAGAHAYLAPSAAHIWGAPDGCRAYPAMAAKFPEAEDSEEAREGTTAHWYASEVLQGRSVTVDTICPETGMPVTDAMIEGAERFIRDASEHQGRFLTAVEKTVRMPAIHPDNWGRADFIWMNLAAKQVGVWDFKFGHRPVDAIDNWQLLDYLIGAIQCWDVKLDPSWTFDLRVYQPRDYVTGKPLKCWNLKYERFAQLRAELYEAAKAATQPNAPARTASACTGCSAAASCKALQIAALEVIDSNPANPLDVVQAGQLLTVLTRGLERIEALKDGLEAQVEQALRSGQRVPGWELEPKYGCTRWNRPIPEVLALGGMFGVDLSKPDAITPKQAIKAGIDETVIAAYSETPNAGVKLVPSDNGKAAARVFSGGS